MSQRQDMIRILKNRYTNLVRNNRHIGIPLVAYLVELFCWFLSDEQIQQVYHQPAPKGQSKGKRIEFIRPREAIPAEQPRQLSLDDYKQER
jgi:hypothetical protein